MSTFDSSRSRAARAAAEPEFLVVFDDPSEDNARTLAEALDIEPEDGPLAAMGIRSMARRSTADHTPAGELLQDVAVAAVDLSGEEQDRLSRSSRVRIIRNELRRRPTPIRATSAPDEDIPTIPTLSSSPIEAYLEGVRDTAALVLRRIRSERGLDAPTAARLASSSLPTTAASLTWALRMVRPGGVGPHDGSGISVAVLDTGIDLEHPDFAGRLSRTGLQSFVPNDPSVADADGHGTHCAGIIGARADVEPRYSVAPGCNLLIGRVLDDKGEGYDRWILKGMQWAVQSGAAVISMSLGSDRDINEPFSEAYERAAKRFLNRGVLVVAAAGNSSDRSFGRIAPVENPAAAPSILAVAAIDRHRQIADFSCGQRDFAAVDLAAPGVDVYSAYPANQHRRLSGTSMATPHVAALAAILASTNPSLRGKALWQALVNRAVPLPPLPASDVGAGLATA